MQLYCRNGVVVAVHDDDQTISAALYGSNVVVLPYNGPLGLADLLGKAIPPIDLLAYARAKRWAVEVSGITFQGHLYATDDRSKLLLSGARASAEADANYATPWFSASGEVVILKAADVIALSNEVAEHVNDTFKVLANLAAAIVAVPPTIADIAGIDAAFASLALSA